MNTVQRSLWGVVAWCDASMLLEPSMCSSRCGRCNGARTNHGTLGRGGSGLEMYCIRFRCMDEFNCLSHASYRAALELASFESIQVHMNYLHLHLHDVGACPM